MKKKIVTICLVVALLLTAAGGTLAYFTASDDKENTFTVGNVSIVLTEPNWDTVGAAEAREVYPGEPLAKDPKVTNDGNNPCFVRISVDGLDCLGDAGMITYRTGHEPDALGTNWVKYGNYFYYVKVLKPGESTTKLFEQIVIPTGVTNADRLSEAGKVIEYSVNVKAEAVQAQGAKSSFTAVEAMTVEEIAAWFATCME